MSELTPSAPLKACYTKTMRYLGIDYGTKKIGLALSDEEGHFAFPHAVIKNDSKALKTIVEICKSERIGGVVIGRSLSYERTENAVMRNVYAFAERFTTETGLPIFYEDEVLTTREASRVITKDVGTDARAAALILESFLNHK